MNDLKNKKCCFIGHKIIYEGGKLTHNVFTTLRNLVKYKGVDTFLFGCHSQFDYYCYDLVCVIYDMFPNIKIEVYKDENPNKSLIDASDYCMFYFNKDYLSNKKGCSEPELVSSYLYAKSKNKKIINVYEKLWFF